MKKRLLIILIITIFLIILGFVINANIKSPIINLQKIPNAITKIKNKETPKTKSIGVIVIALGRYDIFWPEFYETAEQYLLPNHKREYYLFTDNLNIQYNEKENVHIIPKKKLGWPYDSMMRFDFILSQEKELKKMDYLFFFNVNLYFTKTIGNEILPNKLTNNLTVVAHPAFYDKQSFYFPYDRNKNSTAYIPRGKGKYYVAGGLNGGTSKAFLKLAKTCSKNIHKDMKNGVTAKWHDESHINKYILNKNPLVLHPIYMWPTEFEYSIEQQKNKKLAKAILRNKNDYGGHAYLRGEQNQKLQTSTKN